MEALLQRIAERVGVSDAGIDGSCGGRCLVVTGGTRLPARTRAFMDYVQTRLTQALAKAGLA